MKTNPKTPRETQDSPRLTRNPKIVKRCEQRENSRIFASREVLRSLRDAKTVWEAVEGGLAIEPAKTRERVRVSNVWDLKI